MAQIGVTVRRPYGQQRRASPHADPQIQKLQNALNRAGFNVGRADGLAGDKTRGGMEKLFGDTPPQGMTQQAFEQAQKRFQQAMGINPDAFEKMKEAYKEKLAGDNKLYGDNKTRPWRDGVDRANGQNGNYVRGNNSIIRDAFKDIQGAGFTAAQARQGYTYGAPPPRQQPRPQSGPPAAPP